MWRERETFEAEYPFVLSTAESTDKGSIYELAVARQLGSADIKLITSGARSLWIHARKAPQLNIGAAQN